MHCDGSPVKSGQEGKGLAVLTGATAGGAAASSSTVTPPSKLKEQTARADNAQPRDGFLQAQVSTDLTEHDICRMC